MRVGIKKRGFNPVFWHVLWALTQGNIRFIDVFGGSSAGKTHSIAQALALDAFWNNYSAVVFRKELTTVKDSIKKDFNEVIASVFNGEALSKCYTTYEHEFRSIRNIKNQKNPHVIRLKGLDSPEKTKGIKGFRKLYVDELNQFDKEDYKELRRRMRGIDNQQMISSWNPVDSEHWIKKLHDKINWIDLPLYVNEIEWRGIKIDCREWSQLDENSSVQISEDGRRLKIVTTYRDNRWITGGTTPSSEEWGRVDQGVLDEFEEMKIENPDDYTIYGLGQWGVIKNEFPFIRHTNRMIKRPTKIFTEEPLDFSFDFNFQPATCTIGQKVIKGQYDSGLYYHASIGVDGGTRELCRELKDLGWTDHGWIRITGDFSGNQSSSVGGVVSGEALNDFRIIEDELQLPDSAFEHTKKVNPKIKLSRALCNAIMYHLPCIFDEENAIEVIRDIEKAMMVKDKEGKEKLFKDRTKGYAMDYFDNWRYLNNMWFGGDVKNVLQMKDLLSRWD